jgi:uncharacterized protein (DUF2252 family)
MSGIAGRTETLTELLEAGRSTRKRVPRAAQAEWEPVAGWRDPVETLAEQAKTRIPELVPIRHGRMAVSPFTFFRGSAAIMANDLATTETTGLLVQSCGDAHLTNFGMFAAPDRQLVFDLNDFDETHVATFEWDVKRLAASVAVAARDNGFDIPLQRRIARASALGYQSAIAKLSEQPFLEIWYTRFDVMPLMQLADTRITPQQSKLLRRSVAKAQTRTSLQALGRFAQQLDGVFRIKPQPPVITPVPADQRDHMTALVQDALMSYVETLEPSQRVVARHYRFADIARKVSGVGSVGTDGYMVLLMGHRDDDPLFLQFKEAQESVLARYSMPGMHESEGERVVTGQRIMQTASDPLLGWYVDPGSGRHYYARQLRDMKGSLNPSAMDAQALESYAELCGACLGRAHARSGSPWQLSGYIGSGSAFPDAIEQFAMLYADQNDRDYAAFMQALSDGRLPVVYGV